MAIDTALFVLGLDTAIIPDPISITLLPSNTYAIGNRSKTLADCYTETFFPNDSATVAIVAGEGLSVDFTGGGTATSASGTLTGTAELNTALHLEIGTTAVFDVNPVSPDPSVGMTTGAFLISGAGHSIAAIHQHNHGASVPKIIIRYFDGTQHLTDVLGSAPFNQKYRLAFSVSRHFVAVSVNGADPVSIDLDLDFTGWVPRLQANIAFGVAGASSRIGDVRYYPLVIDPNILKRMSA